MTLPPGGRGMHLLSRKEGVCFQKHGTLIPFQIRLRPQQESHNIKLTKVFTMFYFLSNTIVLLINQGIILICAKQPVSYQCNVWHDFYTVLTRAFYEG